MPTVILLPNGNGTIGWANPGTSHALEVDEGVADADDGATEITDSSGGTDIDFFTLDSVPGDFDVAVSFLLRFRGRNVGPRVDDIIRMELELWNNAETTQIGTIQAFVQSESLFTWGTFAAGPEANTDDTIAWNSYRLRMAKVHTATGMPDGSVYEVTAVEVEVEYATVPTPSFPNRIAGNMRQAVRRAMRRAA